MKSRASSRFWKCYQQLPQEVQRLAVKNYHLWQANSNHPSLHFKKLKGSERRFSVRVGDHFRAMGELAEDGMTWVWIGTHADYDKLIGR